MAVTEVVEAPEVPKIFEAASKGEIEVIDEQIKSDPSCTTALNAAGRSALSLAAQKGHLKAVKALLTAGATDSAVVGWTAVHHAAFGGHAEVLSALADKFGKATLAPSGGMPPLLLAASKGHIACMTIILDAAPATLNEAADAHGRTALMCAASGGSAEAVEFLVQKGAAIDSVSSCGKTPMMWAIASHKPAATAALARLGADPEIAAPLPEVLVPGQDRTKGENAEDLANAKHAKDPTLRHIAKYMTGWRQARQAGDTGTPPEMGPLPWVSHAVEFTAKEEAAAKEAAEKAALAADEPMIEEVGEATAAAPADDENDIFGDVSDAVPVGAAAEDAAVKAEAEEAAKAMAADADLDELD